LHASPHHGHKVIILVNLSAAAAAAAGTVKQGKPLLDQCRLLLHLALGGLSDRWSPPLPLQSKQYNEADERSMRLSTSAESKIKTSPVSKSHLAVRVTNRPKTNARNNSTSISMRRPIDQGKRKGRKAIISSGETEE